MAATYQLALIVKNRNSEQFQFLVTLQRRPAPQKYDGLSHVDRELWDLPLAPLTKAAGSDVPPQSAITEDSDGSVNVTRCVTNSIHKLGLYGFNVGEAVSQVEAQVYPPGVQLKSWRYWRLVEEPSFGPGPPLHTLIFMTDFNLDESEIPGGAHWLDSKATVNLLAQAGAHERRIGPLAAVAVSPHVPDGFVNGFTNIHGQEYPPGIIIIPMKAITGWPFTRTNLVIFSESVVLTKENITTFEHAACGDVMIADPGCTGAAQAQLKQIVKTLPRKMLVFVTHHHKDHIEGLHVVRKQNPEAVLVAHELTFRRMGKAKKGFKCISVTGDSKLLVGGHELQVISAPGHTDGHLAVYDSTTGTLVIGDHCVGQGSSILDARSGGNLQDYLDTCRRLLDLNAHMIVPMHGRPNFWPAHLLNGYIKHREARELKVFKAVEGGARSAYEVVASAYADTPTSMWPWALSNTMLHIDHLQVNGKLPKDFSTENFYKSSNFPFAFRCSAAIIRFQVLRRVERLMAASTTTQITTVSLAVLLLAGVTYWASVKW